jgi:DNA-binding response OmpR family regulator
MSSFLSSHRQSMVTPRTTLATSWTANRLRQTKFLTTLISLRKKLDAGPSKHYLRTEPGRHNRHTALQAFY